MYKLSTLDKISLILILIGALNWGLFGLFNVNLVYILFGSVTIIERLIYILVGASGINALLLISKSKFKK
ncbi:DUF378 domain-containing protein [Clostridium grantii]|uniref:DUF378 domain-containing protein n=1 Tax=Clostridium grantii DSM 8605 TaxID=1121316 RepID=A0A1M5QXX6_9CLOT|nr:DUF378 domain-containing protein [Clostridium grantii]SHH18791.1 hypothetical protein SAMN02745207_00356 [Clostridium grantii DSM 8605]